MDKIAEDDGVDVCCEVLDDNGLVVVDEEELEGDEEVVADDVEVGLTLLGDRWGVGLRLRDDKLDESEVVVLSVDEVDVGHKVEVLVVADNELVVADEEELGADKEFVVDSEEVAVVLLDDLRDNDLDVAEFAVETDMVGGGVPQRWRRPTPASLTWLLRTRRALALTTTTVDSGRLMS